MSGLMSFIFDHFQESPDSFHLGIRDKHGTIGGNSTDLIRHRLCSETILAGLRRTRGRFREVHSEHIRNGSLTDDGGLAGTIVPTHFSDGKIHRLLDLPQNRRSRPHTSPKQRFGQTHQFCNEYDEDEDVLVFFGKITRSIPRTTA